MNEPGNTSQKTSFETTTIYIYIYVYENMLFKDFFGLFISILVYIYINICLLSYTYMHMFYYHLFRMQRAIVFPGGTLVKASKCGSA